MAAVESTTDEIVDDAVSDKNETESIECNKQDRDDGQSENDSKSKKSPTEDNICASKSNNKKIQQSMNETEVKSTKTDTGGSKDPKSMTDELENSYYKNFLNPMLADMATQAKKNEDILDQINKKLDDDRKERMKARLSAHIPDVLKGTGRKMSEVVRDLEAMIVCDNFDGNVSDEELVEARILELDDHSQAAVLSHSLAARLLTLDTDHLRRVTNKVRNECEQWLTKLFRFKDGWAMYHEHEWDGIVHMCRLALHQRYPKYATQGFEALYSRPPVIYVRAASPAGYGQYICTHLGLPISCLSVVPCNTAVSSNHKMDVAVFDKLVHDDIAAAKTPTILVAYAGTPVVGHVDELERLQEICEKNSIWMHVEGTHLATLTMFSVPTSVSPAKSGDSMTVNVSPWFGVCGVPCVTLYKRVDPALAQSVGLNVFNPSVKLSCLPLWVSLQSLGHEGIVERVKHSCSLATIMFENLCKRPSLKQISKEKDEKSEEKELSLSSLISKAIHSMMIFEIVSPTVVFRFTRPVDATPGSTVAHYSLMEEDQSAVQSKNIYYDALNAWLCEGLCADNPNIALTAVDVDREGICLRFSPLESAAALGTTVDDVREFITSVDRHIEILQTTVDHRQPFKEIVSQNDRLKWLDKPNWAGLGIIQYIPEDLTDVNTINAELVQKLKNSDMAFSLGDVDGNACVRFGLISEGTDIAELINMVAVVGAEVEEASKYLEKMSDVLLKGIDEMNKELRLEAEHKLRSEGVLRQVPLVGALVNWWSPPPKDTMVGRSFNIQSGEIRSTQTTYKYHMQIQELSDETPTINDPVDGPSSRTSPSTSPSLLLDAPSLTQETNTA